MQRAASGASVRPVGRVHQDVGLLPDQVGGERRRRLRADRDHLDLAGAHLAQHPLQGLEVELVLEAAPPGLEHQGKVAVAPDRLEHPLGPFAADPERHPVAEAGPRQEQRPGGVLAEQGAEEPGPLQPLAQELFHPLGRHHGQQLRAARLGRQLLRDRHHQAVVVVEDLELGAVALLPGGGQGDGERAVDAAAPERVEHDAAPAGRLRLPLLDLLAAGDVLDHDPVAVRQAPAQGRLFGAQEAHQLGRGAPVHGALLGQRRDDAVVVQTRLDRAEEAPHLLRDEEVPVALVRAPEGGHRRRAGGGLDEDVVVGDLLDAPDLGAEGERVTHRALPDELLVELADASACGGPPARRSTSVDPQVVVAAVRDRAAGK